MFLQFALVSEKNRDSSFIPSKKSSNFNSTMSRNIDVSKTPYGSALSVAMSAVEYSLRYAGVAQDFLVLAIKLSFIMAKEIVRNVLPKAKKDLHGETVLITGGAHGVGKQLALDFSKLGAKVVLWDINEEEKDSRSPQPVKTLGKSQKRSRLRDTKGVQSTMKLWKRVGQAIKGHRKKSLDSEKNHCDPSKNVKSVAEEIRANGGKAWWYVCDVTSEKDIQSTAESMKKDVGDITILVNNAGIMQNVPLLELDSEKIKRTFDVNILAHFWMIRTFLPKMQENNYGHIVAIASAAGLLGHVNQSDYSASKFAVVGMMEAFSEEMRLKNCDVRFTTICPVTVNTGLNQHPVSKYPLIAPILSIEEASQQILSAVRTEEFLVSLPRSTSFVILLSKLLPRQITCEVMDFLEYCRVSNSVPVLIKDENLKEKIAI